MEWEEKATEQEPRIKQRSGKFFENWPEDSPNFYHAGPSPEGYYPLHMHRLYELTVVASGEIEIQINQTTYLLHAGEACLIFPHQLHANHVRIPGEQVTAVFAPQMLGSFDRQKAGMIPVSNLLRLNDAVFSAPLLVKELTREKSNFFRIRANLFYLISEAEDQFVFRPRRSKTDKDLMLISSMLDFVQKHWQEDCSLLRCARELGYEYTYLSKYFIDATGMQYKSYVNHLRIFNACNQMILSDMSIAQLSEWCGFESLRSFYRNFAAVMHCTATEYLSDNQNTRREWSKRRHKGIVPQAQESLAENEKEFR